jgi:hypothetical protein
MWLLTQNPVQTQIAARTAVLLESFAQNSHDRKRTVCRDGRCSDSESAKPFLGMI